MTEFLYSPTIGGMPANNPIRFKTFEQAQAYLTQKRLTLAGPYTEPSGDQWWRIFDNGEWRGILDRRQCPDRIKVRADQVQPGVWR